MDVCIPQNNINILTIEPVALKSEIKDPISQLIDTFNSISLADMDSVKLMNRIDTKFIIGDSQLPELLKMALKHYRVVEIDGKRIIPYSSIYFDTDDTEMYMMHHNGKLNRYKVRMRSYVDSHICFLEIKRKNNKGRTSKKRIEISNEQFEMMTLEEKEQLFVERKSPYQAILLKPQIQNAFHRITLVDKNLTERVTLDTGLTYKKLPNGITKNVDGLVIIEIKQDGACHSHFRDNLNELSISSGSLSKYCLGMVLVNPLLKSNRFKNKIRKITKTIHHNHGTN